MTESYRRPWIPCLHCGAMRSRGLVVVDGSLFLVCKNCGQPDDPHVPAS